MLRNLLKKYGLLSLKTTKLLFRPISTCLIDTFSPIGTDTWQDVASQVEAINHSTTEVLGCELIAAIVKG